MKEILYLTNERREKNLPAQAVEELRARLRGRLLCEDDSGYDDLRQVWNGMIDRKPALIVQCIGAHDVIESIRFARTHDIATAVKGGGHNVAGMAVCAKGLMIDLSPMRSVHVDAQQKTVRVGGGCLLGDVDCETQRNGLAVSAGIVSHTGVAGLTLGGGFGWISRKHGLSIDNLLSVDLVTAEGQLLTASPEAHPELFWAIRGGGGNFGIVVSFEFKCAEIGTEVYSGLIVKKFEDARQYIQFHRDYVRTLPDEMTVWMVVRHAPPLPFLPAEVHGKMIVVVPFVWLGNEAEGRDLIRPIQEATPSHAEAIGMNPWAAWQSGFDGLVGHGARNYWKSHHITGLSDECIDQTIAFGETMPSAECEIFIPHMEGAPSRVPIEETAFSHRKTPFVLNIHTRWQDAADDDRCIAWARDFHAATQAFAQGVYVNFLSEEGDERVKEAYTESVWDRLVKVKRQYDPDNFFRMNQNIKP